MSLILVDKKTTELAYDTAMGTAIGPQCTTI